MPGRGNKNDKGRVIIKDGISITEKNNNNLIFPLPVFVFCMCAYAEKKMAFTDLLQVTHTQKEMNQIER